MVNDFGRRNVINPESGFEDSEAEIHVLCIHEIGWTETA
jgi:hypothetical protein